jgi:hypothetical protein
MFAAKILKSMACVRQPRDRENRERGLDMAQSKSSGRERETDIQVVYHLIKAAEVDTAFRDLYLQRAAERLASSFSRAEYERLKSQPATLDQLMRETRQAVARQNWSRVQELSTQVSALQGALQAKQSDLQLADKVYEAPEVAIDPFSSAFDVLLGRTGQAKDALRDELVAALSALEKADRDWSSFFAARLGYFAKLSILATQPTEAVTSKDDVGRLQQRAAEAAERGNVEELKRIAQEMLKVRPAAESAGRAGERKAPVGSRPAYPPELGESFPGEAVERARRLGLAHVQLKISFPALPELAQETFDRYGWHPSFPAAEVAKNGELHFRPLLEQAKIPQEIIEPLLEASTLFALHPFVNSAGVRYFPLFPDNEFVLVEDYPEDAVPAEPSELLTALGLTRRNGLSRVEIEVRLREHGATLTRERLGLDPTKFRIVCIPFDVYARVGQERKWGQQPRWTHVDGYQLSKGGRMRALVGGDVRFGGLFDLCSISQIDEREAVLARFAVIHRERLMVR